MTVTPLAQTHLSCTTVKHRTLWQKRARSGVLFALPILVFETCLLFFPIAQTFYYSFTNWNGLSSHFVGLKNYSSLVHDPIFWRILANNGILLLSIPVAVMLPLGAAFLLHQHVVGWRFFQSAFYLPTVISWVVIGMVAVQIFAGHGILNRVLAVFGLHQNMLAHPVPALMVVIIAFIWSLFGSNMIVFIGGMATMPRELYEAARVDGANGFTIFWYITVPLLRRFIQFNVILTLITAFTGLFSLIFVMTGGGPGFGTTTLEFFIYEQAFNVGSFGYAATLGVVLFILMVSVTVFQIPLLLREGD